MAAAQKGTTDMTQNGEATTELLVLDPRRDGWAALVAEAGPGTAVLVLDARRDGLTEVLEMLRGRPAFRRIRIADAGGPGRLLLGSLTLDMPAMAAREAELATLGEALAPDGVLLLSGGGGDSSAAGGRFAAALARLMGRDVVTARDWMPRGIEALAGMPAAFMTDAVTPATWRAGPA